MIYVKLYAFKLVSDASGGSKEFKASVHKSLTLNRPDRHSTSVSGGQLKYGDQFFFVTVRYKKNMRTQKRLLAGNFSKEFREDVCACFNVVNKGKCWVMTDESFCASCRRNLNHWQDS